MPYVDHYLNLAFNIMSNIENMMDFDYAPASKKRKASGMALSKADIGRILSVRSNKMYPYKDYGRVVRKRGTEGSLARYGTTLSKANKEQKFNRGNRIESSRELCRRPNPAARVTV